MTVFNGSVFLKEPFAAAFGNTKLGKTQLQRFAILCDLLIVQIVLDAGGLGGQLLDQEFCPFEGNLKRSF